MGYRLPYHFGCPALILLVAVAVLADQSSTSSIQDLFAAGDITVQGQGLGADSGDNLVLSLRNNTSRKIEVDIQAGTIMSPGESRFAPMVIRRVRGIFIDPTSFEVIDKVELAPRQSIRLLIETFNMQFGRETPARGAVLHVDGADPLLKILLERSLAKGYSLKLVQAAVWLRSGGVTDDRLRQRLGIDSLSVKEARDFYLQVEGEHHAGSD